MTTRMTWRTATTNREETKAVKAALASKGIEASVGHGRGTDGAWLIVELHQKGIYDYDVLIAYLEHITGRLPGLENSMIELHV